MKLSYLVKMRKYAKILNANKKVSKIIIANFYFM
ncbi:hypothetical protein GIG_02398 [Mycoplasmopsis anatis 1340]|uniref:Uncharacterized protein n=1 Tax=Mycoplasmopsis anatis 1340 TaxID=1034808 RepID=F9QDH2_9BACT|nr:hypothetical protein GIG_02398 [Mycoplasmopsis anatis 1340]